jgi:DNA-binding NarL/FixJ family response regulator
MHPFLARIEHPAQFERLNPILENMNHNGASRQETGVPRRGPWRSTGNGGLRVLVLSGLPIVRAGISRLIRVEFGAQSQVLRASWTERDKALSAAGGSADLVVVHPDDGTAHDAWPTVAQAALHAAIVVALPGMGTAHRPATARAGVRAVALEARLDAWRHVLRVAVSEAQRDGGPVARANGDGRQRALRARQANLPAGTWPLTQRQREVYEMLRRGLSNKSIAETMGLSVGTVKLHVAAVLHAMNARNRVDIVLRRPREADPRLAGGGAVTARQRKSLEDEES